MTGHTHTLITSYFCSYCDKQYKSERWVLRHVAIHHDGIGAPEKWEFCETATCRHADRIH